MKMQPLGDRVAVRMLPNPALANVDPRIIIPNTADNKSYWGEVIAVGPGIRHHVTGEIYPVAVKVGDIIFFSKYAALEYEFPGDREIYACIKEDNIIGIQKD